MSCGINYRRGSDLALLWLWGRPTAAAPIGPLVWKLLYATGSALKSKKKKKKKSNNWIFKANKDISDMQCDF